MWGDDMDLITTQIVDDVAVVPGPGAGRILDSDLESDYEWLHAQNRWAKYASFVYVYMHVQVIDVHIMFQQHFVSHNPTRHPYPPERHWKRCDFYLQRGSSLGARVCGSIASTHPSSSRLGSPTCPVLEKTQLLAMWRIFCQVGVSENVVYPFLPNGFADHYPY